jgi:hypothetical protein
MTINLKRKGKTPWLTHLLSAPLVTARRRFDQLERRPVILAAVTK